MCVISPACVLPAADPSPVQISNASDTRVDKLESAFKVGQSVDGRVVGQRHMDGLVAVSLKPSVVDAPFFTLDDITVGALVEVTLVAVDTSAGGGATVALAPGLKGTVPLAHCSDAGTATAAKKLRAGARLKARVLQVDTRTRRVLATLKPSVVNSKFPPLCSVADASPGQVAHGCITGIQAYGVFVAFFGDVRGLAHARHCGLAPGQSLQDAFRVGDAIKATVLGVTTHATRGPVLDLSLGTPAAAAAADEGSALTLLQEVPTAVVARVADDAVYLRLDAAAAGLEVRLEAAHLADDAASSAALLAALNPGAQLGPLLVLATTPRLAVTLKPALVFAAAAGGVPGDLAAVSLGHLLTGFVASVSPAGVFVRFAQRLTGLAPTAALFDGLSTVTPDTAFPLGRSVCGVVTALDTAAGRLTLSLRPSDVASKAGAASLRALLRSTALTDAVVAAKAGESGEWAAKYPRGHRVACTLAQVKPSMGVLDLEGDDDAVGLTLGPHLQEAGNPGVGESIVGIVLGCNVSEGLVDIGIRPQLVQPAAAQAGAKRKAKAKAPPVAGLAPGEAVTAEVELVKRDYLVVSLPDHGRSIALLQVRALGECHTTPGAAGLDDTFAVGQALRCCAAGPLGTAGDDVQLLTLEPGRGGGAPRTPRGDAEARTGVRSGTITAVRPLELHVRLPSGRQGRVHVTQLPPAAPPKKRKKASAQPRASPLAGYSVGDSVQVHVTGTLAGVDAPDGHSMLSLTLVHPDGGEGYKPPTLDALVPGGGAVVGYIDTVTDDAAWVALAPALRGRLFALDAADDGHGGSAALTERFSPGQAVTCYVLSCDAHKRHVDLSTAPPGDEEEDQAPGVGALVRCRVVKVVPGIGLYVQCRAPRGAHVDGRIAMTDLGDVYTPTPCDALPPGTILSAVVVGTSAGGHLDLTLRPSRGAHPRDASDGGGDGDGLQQPEIKALSDVTPGAVLHGYVKSATPKGVFVTLGRGLDARVKLSNLADAFVPSPETAFPPGSVVTGRVLAVETATHRIELSLKESDVTGGAPMGLGDLTVGQVVRGTVKRVETFGVFVTLAGGGVTGMVHISMFADGPRIKDLQQRIAPGKKVVCKVMAADTDTGRLSLGMKASLFEEGELQEGDAELNAGAGGDGEEDEPLLDTEAVEDEMEEAPEEPPVRKRKTGAAAAAPAAAPARMQPAAEVLARLMGAGDDEELAFKWAAPEPGLPQALAGGEDEDDPDAVAADPAAVAAAAKKARRKEKKAREEALRVRERALAAGNSTPHSEADFQRLLVGSPNSSYLWIAYMAHLAGLGEPAQARAVAERALSGQPGSISYREQREQLNVWVAWMNLEAAYGEEPRDAAVGRVFAAACKQSDHKALHLALVGTHQRAGRKDAATAAAGALTRAFRTSCKAWLRAFSLHLGCENPGAARGCLDAAVQALPKRKHAKFLVAAGLAEFRIGDPERGRALLEGVLAAQPRRADVWNVYLDAEAKHGGDTLRARALFQRAVCCGLPPKRCKPLFKKFLAWERANGEAADVARVKQMAAEYVSSQVEHLVHEEDGDE
jgi:rRNA biogenesis protein RRP5